MKKTMNITFNILRLFLGGMMVYGGIGKFGKPTPKADSTLVMEETKKQELLQNEEVLRMKNYFFGMKQTGFAYELLGIAEILGGLLVLSQLFSVIGPLILIPVTLHILVFHIKLEPNETKELLMSVLFFAINVVLLVKEYKSFKPLLKIKVWG
jgi:uncharacterized membrane protein YphA (DoxX/SURF4 family)